MPRRPTQDSIPSPRGRSPASGRTPGVAAVLLGVLLATTLARAADPPVPAYQGFVTDTAHVVSDPVRRRIEQVVTELQQKTGAEIAVLTVPTTAPLDDFTYAMRVADTWKPGRKKDDSGVVVLVATQDRKLRIVTGYGVEGILPDGLVGEIQDREMVPAFKAGRVEDGIVRGVLAIAGHIAAAHDVTLTGVPAPVRRAPQPGLPWWVVVLIVIVVLVVIANSDHSQGVGGGRRRGGYIPGPGPIGFPGGWSDGGGGGFGGFGGGGFGGGGAGRDW